MAGSLDDAAQADLFFIPFPPMERLATVGDRRTAATVAADGTVGWMCLPRFDGTPVFGALLDLQKGGFWRLGPDAREFGTQRYQPGTAVRGMGQGADGGTCPGDGQRPVTRTSAASPSATATRP